MLESKNVRNMIQFVKVSMNKHAQTVINADKISI